MWNLFDFTDGRGESVLQVWVEEEKLSKRDIGQMNQKLDMLTVSGPNLPPKLLAGPIHKHIYKLKVHGDRMLRPMLCKGPVKMEEEYTMLLGAIEADGELDHGPDEAEHNRSIIVADVSRRCQHQRYERRKSKTESSGGSPAGTR